eukprot:TRINITY_DN25936_c0_g1_i1.p1 TRINITY_DN25936_c0_g1~~TRINITY_DN25936_c0_g1_i1.p1  ORF type:complete len:412 (-),score=149.95 TRINITY_DN25936_c0_g1_i1:62-1297(-)
MGMFSKKPSKLHQANTQLQAESNKLSELSEAVEGLKERLKTQQENQRRLAAQKNNLKDAFGRLQTARTKLRPQLNELQEELQSCAGRKAAFEQQCAGDVRESQRAREWLDRLRQASIMLTSAQQRRRAEEVAAPATVAATSESPPVAATDASACAAAEGQGHLQALPAEAMRLAQQQHDELSKRIQQTAAKTVALDEEREALSGERAQLLDEQRALKADTAALVEAKADAAERLEQAHAEVAALRGRYEAMKLELETAQRDADSLSRRHEAVVADLESLRGRRTDLRNAAFSEITEARRKWSSTSRARERAMVDQQIHQKELVGLASAHSQLIAAGGGALTLGQQGAGGMLDPISSDSKSALLKASLVLPRAAPLQNFAPAVQLTSLRTPRNDLQFAGHRLLLGPAASTTV